MSRTDTAPPRKKPRTDALSLQRQHLAYLTANPDKDHTTLSTDTTSTTNAVPASLAPPPDFVNSIQGASSGAGSGEFHVYKASRRREYERLQFMDEQTRKEADDAAYAHRRAELKELDDAKTEKNRRKREKVKAAKAKAKTEGEAASVVNHAPSVTVTGHS